MKAVFLAVLFVSSVVRAASPPGYVPSGAQWFPCAMTRYSDPLKLSGMVGITRLKLQSRGCYIGFFGQLEAGAGGGKVCAGYRLGKHQFLPVYNIGLSASLMQTWGNPLGEVESGQTYLGAELSTALSVIGLNGGIYRHIAGDSDNDEWIWTIGAGLGI